jgi:hypothetical protein
VNKPRERLKKRLVYPRSAFRERDSENGNSIHVHYIYRWVEEDAVSGCADTIESVSTTTERDVVVGLLRRSAAVVAIMIMGDAS